MTTLFIGEQDRRERSQILASTPTDYEALKPGFFEGLPSAFASGLDRAAATFSGLSVDYQRTTPVGAALSMYDAFKGTNTFDTLHARERKAVDTWIGESRLDPATHGTAGTILYGVTSQLPALVASFVGTPLAGAAIAGGSTFEGTRADLASAGVDASTARDAALADAGFAAIGALLPGSLGGGKLLNTLAVGPGINIAQDVASRYAVAGQLEARGYGELAGQYKNLDSASLIADVIIGGAFGYIGAKFHQPEIDAALTASQVRARLMGTLGAPVDMASQAKHSAAFDKALNDLANERPVDVSGVEGAAFLRDREGALARVLAANGYHEEVAQLRELEAELAQRGIKLPDEEPLPDVPLPDAAPKPRAPVAEQAATPETVHEQSTVAAAARVESPDPVPTPVGDVAPKVALARADREVATAEAESGKFAAAVECALRNGT